jgi:hypothetical protein
MIYGPDNRPEEVTFKVRPANRSDLQMQVAEHVADICWQIGITENMIHDIRMSEPAHGMDDEGTFSQVTVRFIYR